jgi:nucleoside-diphosphate-sugar epimerase
VIDRAKQALGWTPKTPLEEGLKRTITEFRARLDLLARKPATELQVSQ